MVDSADLLVVTPKNAEASVFNAKPANLRHKAPVVENKRDIYNQAS